MSSTGQSPNDQIRRYQEELTELQKQHRQWQALEQDLRRGLARLALFGFGNDPRLDDKLTRLRSAIRRDEPADTVAGLVSEVEETSRGLDLSKTEPADIQRYTLISLLNNLSFPRRLGAEVRSLRRRLRETGDDESSSQLIQEAAELIERSQSAGQSRRGLARLLGGEKSAPENGAGPQGARTSQLAVFLDHLQAPAALESDLEPIRERAAAGVENDELRRLADKLSAHIQELGAQKDGEASLPADLEEALHHLLDLLELPEEQQDSETFDPQSLQARLRSGVTLGELPELLQDIQGLVAEVREAYERECRELEAFLQQLISHLNDLNAHISATEKLHAASSNGHRELGDQLDAAMDGMESHLAEAHDLHALQKAVQTRLDTIRANVSAHREADRERDQAFEAEVELLYNRVKESEQEADRLKEALRQERELAHHDTLTGLPNRLGYEEQIRQAAAYWRRTGSPLSLVVLDVDYFKSVNDNYGHQAGDRALEAVAELLRSNLQRETDFVARYGGEEFVCLLPATEEEQAAQLAERMREAVERARFTYQSSTGPGLTISAGVTAFRDDDTPESAFERADRALLQAKNNGRNRVRRGKPS
jgi:diguanylate cyclase